ncbi:MAG: DsbA family protein [Halorhabdus sp.]
MRDSQRSIQSTRRRFLTGAGSVAAVGIAGCLGQQSDPPDVPTLGDRDAAVTVQVFEDFACPHCAAYSLEHFPQIRENYIDPGDIRYEYYNFPIPVDPTESWRAANAARYVYEAVGNDAFWNYSKGLYANQSSLGPSLYAERARAVGADPAAVRTAAVDRTRQDAVEASRQYGLDLGVEGTPWIVVDGQAVTTYDYATVSTAIDDALASESG